MTMRIIFFYIRSGKNIIKEIIIILFKRDKRRRTIIKLG